MGPSKVRTISAEEHLKLIAPYKAYFESIMNEPHPLRVRNTQKKMIDKADLESLNKEIQVIREHRGFAEFRRLSGYRTAVTHGTLAANDLIYLQADDPAIFVVEEDIGSLLLETDLEGSSLEDLRLPFRTVYLQLPKNPYKTWIPGEEGNLEGAYVSEDLSQEGATWYLFLLVGRKDVMIDPCDDVLFSIPVLFEAGSLEEQVGARIADILTRKGDPEELKNIGQFPQVFRWILNCLLYINSEGADLKKGWFHEKTAATMKGAKGNKKRNIRHALEETSTEVTWVGRTIKIDKVHFHGEPRGPLEGEREGPRLHRVRGFWRRQVCGVGRSERKLTWVKPFLRGKGRDVLEKVYRVE